MRQRSPIQQWTLAMYLQKQVVKQQNTCLSVVWAGIRERISEWRGKFFWCQAPHEHDQERWHWIQKLVIQIVSNCNSCSSTHLFLCSHQPLTKVLLAKRRDEIEGCSCAMHFCCVFELLQRMRNKILWTKIKVEVCGNGRYNWVDKLSTSN